MTDMESWEIIKLLGTGNVKLALHALDRWGKDASFDPEPLLAALTSSDPTVLKVALAHAAERHPTACLGAVTALFQREDPVARRLAVEAMIPAFGDIARERLEQLLEKEQHPFVIASGVKAASRMGVKAERLTPFLKHEDSRIRANTTRAIVATKAPPDIMRSILEPLLKDPAPRVQNEALRGLAGMIPPEELREIVQKRRAAYDGEARTSLVHLIYDLPLPGKASLLAELLDDANPEVEVAAASCLAKIGDSESWKALADGYLRQAEPARAEAILKLIPAVPANVVLFATERGGGRIVDASSELARRVLAFAAIVKNDWQLFIPWILGGLERRENEIREVALVAVRERLSYFSANMEDLLRRPERMGSPRERALVAQIRWRAGQMAGLETLKSFLHNEDEIFRIEAARALREEPALLAKKALKDAGFVDAPEAPTTPAAPVAKGPIKLI
ncbi:MAG: hypothetical protein HQM09_13030 [Candidatus Riflebacteria bacterium]|nr:hypothetical protein [Candidatus Riflebacteria bacterium]